MAKYKESTTEIAITNVDPRIRMKEIRAKVKTFLKGNTFGLNHLGDMADNMADARRVIIALQDLLETKDKKHRKATLHVCDLVDILDGMKETQHELVFMVEQRNHEIYELDHMNNMLQQENAALRREVDYMRQQRDAVLTTMKLQANTKAPEPMVMSVDMGSSNAAEPACRRSPTTFEELLKGLVYNGGTVSGRLR